MGPLWHSQTLTSCHLRKKLLAVPPPLLFRVKHLMDRLTRVR